MIKHTKIPAFLLILIFMFGGCSNKNRNNTPFNPKDILQKFIIHIPSAQEEAEYVFYLLNSAPLLEGNGYNLSLPDDPLINSLKSKVYGENRLDDNDLDQLISLFKNKIHNRINYFEAFDVVKKTARVADMQIKIFEAYKQKWSFFIPEYYYVLLSLYGTSGTAFSDNVIVLKVSADNDLQRILGAILHEAVHIGIHESIIQKYNVPWQINERIADHFVSRHFLQIVPNYRMQSVGNSSIDIIFEDNDVFDYLPVRVGEFMNDIKY
jgi:hypothetical protein